MIDDIKNDFILGRDWNKLETNLENNLQYKWTSQSSTIYIKNSEHYENLKLRIYNGTDVFQKRNLKIFVDGELVENCNFFNKTIYLDLKINIKNKREVTLSTENYFCPLRIFKDSNDNRNLGFKIYSFVIDTDEKNNVLVPINFIKVEAEEEYFIDTTKYTYNISDINIDKLVKAVYYVGQYGTSGYASAAKGYIYKYFIKGINIKWHSLKFDDTSLSKDCQYNIIAESTINNNYDEYNAFIYHSTPDLWRYLNDELKYLNYNKNKVGYCVWETNKLPKLWVEAINSEVNEVWVPSNYNKEIFNESGVNIPIKVIPHEFLYKQLYNKDEINLYSISGNGYIKDKDVYTFYTIGELIERKGIEDLINVFCKTFNKNDKVRLIIKTHYKNYSSHNKQYCLDKLDSIIKQYTNPPEIHYLIDNLSENSILALHSIGDCYISLTKSEGFGMTIFDAFKYGKEIITTGYSGHLDFLGKDYRGLVDYKLDYVKNMKNFSSNYSDDTMWAYPNLNHAAELMKGIIK